jgi:hypothetical protein
MAITSYQHFLPEISTRLPACPPVLIEQQLAQSARMLCTQSLANVQRLTADAVTYTLTKPTDHEIFKVWEVRVKSGDSIVSISNTAPSITLSGDVSNRYPAGTVLALLGTDSATDDGSYTVLSVTTSGGNTVITPTVAPTAADTTGEGTAGVSGATDGSVVSPYLYEFRLPDTLVFCTPPMSTAQANGLQIDVAVAPEEDLESYSNIDFDFVTRWADTIKAGALVRLFRMEDRAWGSSQAADREMAIYEYGLVGARRESYTHFVARDLKMKAPSFI